MLCKQIKYNCFFRKPGKFFGKQWEPMTVDETGAFSVFEIGNVPKMIREPYKAGVDFWNSLNLNTHHHHHVKGQ